MRNLKKLLAVVVAICTMLAFTVPAFAADSTLAADTQTCANIGVVVGTGTGVTAEYAATEPTRIQAAVMLLRLTGNLTEAQSYPTTDNFADADKANWAKPLMAFLKAHPELGFVGDGKNFMPNDKITAQQYYKVLLTALGYSIPGDYAFANTLTFAKETLGLAMGGNATPFTINSLATATVEALKATQKGATLNLATTLVNAGKLDKAKVSAEKLLTAAAVSSVTVAGVKTVKATFNQAVDTAKAVIKVKRGAAIYGSTVVWNDAKDTATITTIVNLPAADYSLEVSGLTDTALTKAFTVSAEKASKIEVVSKSVDLANNAKISFKVLNQYGEGMTTAVKSNETVVVAYNTTQKKAVVLATSADDKYTFPGTFAADAKVGDVVRVTISYAGLTIQSNVNVIEVASGATIAFSDVAPLANTSRITVGDAGLVIPYTLNDQYGVASKFSTQAADFDGNDNVETFGSVQFVSSNPAIVDVDTFAVDANGKMTFAAGATAGTATITAVINASGAVATFAVTVNKVAVADSLAINAPAALVSAGESVDLAVTGADQFGTAIAADKLAVGAKTSSDQTVVKDADISLANGKLTVKTTGAGTATISVKNVAGDKVIGTVSIVVEAKAVATEITKVTFSPKFETTASKTITVDDFTVIDQYGRAIKGADLTGFAVAKKDAAVATFGLAGKTFTAGAAAGSQVFTMNATYGGATTPDIEFTLGVVATSDITAYAITPASTMSTAAGHDVTLELTGKTAAGDTVVLKAGKITSATSTDASVATAALNVVTGHAKGTATIALWNNATKLAETTVTVSDVAPVATTIKFGTLPAIAAGVTGANIGAVLEVKDQYGVVIAGPAGLFTSSSATIVIDNAAGAGYGKVKTNTAVAGDKVTIGFVTSNGLVVTTEVTVQ